MKDEMAKCATPCRDPYYNRVDPEIAKLVTLADSIERAKEAFEVDFDAFTLQDAYKMRRYLAKALEVTEFAVNFLEGEAAQQTHKYYRDQEYSHAKAFVEAYEKEGE